MINPPPPFKAAWVYVGPPGDFGWTFAHDQGRLAVENEVDGVETTFVPSVPESDAEAAIEQLVTDGNNIIFTTSFGYMQATANVAARHPDVYFEHCSGYMAADNLANYFGRMHQARYLTGIVAARMTTTNHLGIVGAHPIPEVIGHINSITLGARSVNPAVQVHVRWANAWYDPTGVEVLANELINTENVDVLFVDEDSTAAVYVARDQSKYVIGYNSDALSFAPDAVLTSAIWHWDIYYSRRVREAMDGSWVSGSYFGPIADGIIGLGQWGDAVPMAVRDEVDMVRTRLVNAEFDVFDGEFRRQDGTVWVPAGMSLTDAEVLSICGFVEGVTGTIPMTCDVSVCPSGMSCAAM